MSERFVTGGYKIYDTYKDDEYLVNNVDAQRIADKMNSLDKKARDMSKALSKLQIQFNEMQKKLEEMDDE